MGAGVDVEPESKNVLLADGGSLAYDSLIVATGTQSSYFGHDEWREWAPGLKSVEEAITIRHKILYAFEVAERILDPVQRRAWLTFVIVGAGPTGVELAGAIGEIARQTLKNDFRSIHSEEARIILLDGAPRVLMPFPEDLAQKAERSLAKLGVQVKCDAMVKDVDREGLAIEEGKHSDRIGAKTVIWARGRGGERRWSRDFATGSRAGVGVHTPDVHSHIPKSSSGFHPVGNSRPHFQSRRAADARRCPNGLQFQ